MKKLIYMLLLVPFGALGYISYPGMDTCKSQYGVMSYSTIGGTCKCTAGWIFAKDELGSLSCVDASSYCHSNYGINSSYSSLNNSCICDSGYSFDKDNQCVKSNYYMDIGIYEIKEDTMEMLVLSKNMDRYYIKYMAGCVGIKDYLGDIISINLGTNNSIDMFDDIILPSGMSCDIFSSNIVDKDYTIYTCKDNFGEHAISIPGNKCTCEAGYNWNDKKTECVKEKVEFPSFIKKNGFCYKSFKNKVTKVNKSYCK